MNRQDVKLARRAVVTAIVGIVMHLLAAAPAAAQLRIVSYNTLTAENPGQQTARPESAIVLAAIGAEVVGGIAKPIDVLLLQEQHTTAVTTQSFVDVLNGIYGPGVYARSSIDALCSDFDLRRGGGPALVYNTQTVQLVSEIRFGTVNGSSQPRSTLRYQLRPVGYDASADFYAYNSHYKAGSTTTDQNRRQVEAVSVRNNANARGEGAHLIFAGDFNVQSSGETMFQTLRAAGAGQAVDPIDASGTPAATVTWNNNSAFKRIHTQDPGAAMDDRFDFQLVSGEMLDDEGMSYLSGSYHAFGNNGTHTYNSTLGGTGASAAVLMALRTNSDHLPVVADYQLPASMGVLVAAAPMSVTLGASISLDVTVSNIAAVVAAIGADELDYTLSVSGDLSGGVSGIDFALGGGNVHQVTLNTSTIGAKNGVITVTSSSQGAAGALFTMPISFDVVAPFLAADFDENGLVDGEDLVTWQANFGLTEIAVKANGDADLDGNVDGADFLAWQQQLGTLPLVAVAASVPEPATLYMAFYASYAAWRWKRSLSPRSVTGG